MKLPEPSKTQHQDGEHFSWNQIAPSLEAFDKENARVEKIEAAQRSVYERAVVKVHARLELYEQLKNTIEPQDAQNWKQELTDYENLILAGVVAVQAQQAGKKYDEQIFNRFLNELQRFNFMEQFEPPLIVPPQNSGSDWQHVGELFCSTLPKVDKFRRRFRIMRRWPTRSKMEMSAVSIPRSRICVRRSFQISRAR